MSHARTVARDDALVEALRAIDAVLGDTEPTERELAIVRAIQALRSPDPVRVARLVPVDYLAQVQRLARDGWEHQYAGHGLVTGPEHDAVAGIDTPLGRLAATVWRVEWTGKRGERVAWRAAYTLNSESISIRDIREVGLAQRLFTRNRKAKA